MPTLTFDATDEQYAALTEYVAKLPEPVTAEAYFTQRNAHWLRPIVEQYKQRIKETYAAEAQRVYERATPEERAFMDSLRLKYPEEQP